MCIGERVEVCVHGEVCVGVCVVMHAEGCACGDVCVEVCIEVCLGVCVCSRGMCVCIGVSV